MPPTQHRTSAPDVRYEPDPDEIARLAADEGRFDDLTPDEWKLEVAHNDALAAALFAHLLELDQLAGAHRDDVDIDTAQYDELETGTEADSDQ